jgi:uncharacterized protein VirK/YbjX
VDAVRSNNVPIQPGDQQLRERLRSLRWRASVKRRKLGIVLATIAGNGRALLQILLSPKLAPVRRELRRQPGIVTFLAAPLVSATWDAKTRISRIVDHCLMIDRIGAPFNGARRARNLVCRLPAPIDAYYVAIETPPPKMRDGLLTLVLMKEDVGVFTLSFIFAAGQNGLEAYVGAVQGSAEQDAGDINRSFTKAANGVRPRDFVIEMFRAICHEIGATCFYGVSDSIRHQKSDYFRIGATDYDQVKLNYDAAWVERGGTLLPNGFFELSSTRPERPPESIPARKRAMYRNRAEMWDEIDRRIAGIAQIRRP